MINECRNGVVHCLKITMMPFMITCNDDGGDYDGDVSRDRDYDG
jgi:hypothetical protein